MGLISTKRVRQWGLSFLTIGTLVFSVSGNLGIGNAARLGHTANATGANIMVEPIAAAALWPGSLDPAQISALYDAEIEKKIYAGLLKQSYNDKTGKFDVVPDLAAAMPTISKDGLTYTFKIRPDAMFSDGTPVTAADFVASFERVLVPAANSGVNYYLFDIKGASQMAAGKAKHLSGVKAIDDHTLQITLASPIVYFPYELTYNTGDVVKKSFAYNADLTTKPANVIGAGPWMLKGGTWKYKSEIDLVPNPYYWESKKFKLKEIHIVFTGTEETMYNAYKAGQYPMTWLPSVDVKPSRSLPEYHEVGVLGDLWLAMNVNVKPFTDQHFRLAVNYAIDRNAIANGVDHGTVKPLYCWYPFGIVGYESDCASKYPTYNVTMAKQELALAMKDMGGTLPTGTQLEYASELADRGREAAQVQADLKAVGITIGLHPVPRATWIKDGNSGKTPFIISDWFDDYPDPQDFSDYLVRTGAGENWGRYSNPKVDALFDKGNVEKDAATREKLYQQAQDIIMKDSPIVMLYQFADQALISAKWHGVELNPSWGNAPQPIAGDWANVTVSQ